MFSWKLPETFKPIILGITPEHVTAQKMKSSIKEFFSKFFGSFLRIWSHLPKKFYAAVLNFISF